MIPTKTLLQWLTIFLSLDIVLTLIMVGYMGATELNMLASMLGFTWFMVLKVVASAVAVYAIYRYCISSVPTFTRYGIIMLGTVYGAFCASNAYQIVGAVA